MWWFFSVLTICVTVLSGVILTLRHDFKVQRMVEEAKTTRKTIEATAVELSDWSRRQLP